MRLLKSGILILFVTLFTSCNLFRAENATTPEEVQTAVPEVSVKFTGVKPYYVNGELDKEVTFVKGVRNGITKTYYPSGGLKQVLYYNNALRTDTARWFYEDGKLFRTTPYVMDTIHGAQVQYYRSGRIKARMSYDMGLRLPDLEEYYDNGKLKIYKREIVITTRDEYEERGVFKVFAELDVKPTVVVFYRGELVNGAFDPYKVDKLTNSGGIGFLELRKSTTGNNGYVGIIAEYTTDFGNKNYLYKRVKVPYRDVN